MREVWVLSLSWEDPLEKEGKGYPFQYAGLENSIDCIVHRVAKSQTWLNNCHLHDISNFLQNFHTLFHGGCTNSHSCKQCVSSLLHILANTCYFLSFCWSNRCEVISHCGFDLHFLDYQWYWTSFHLPVGHLSVLFESKYLFRSSVHFPITFSHFCKLSFIWLMVSFGVQKLFS